MDSITGWNDVSFHGSNQILTPNIDALAYNGIILNSHYVQPSGSATKAALLTGKYPIKLGMQGDSIQPSDTRALPERKILPEYLKDIGYVTYLAGKWDLGYNRWNDTPTYRGFDHHLGSYNSWTSYYDFLTTTTVLRLYFNVCTYTSECYASCAATKCIYMNRSGERQGLFRIRYTERHTTGVGSGWSIRNRRPYRLCGRYDPAARHNETPIHDDLTSGASCSESCQATGSSTGDRR
ncbi:arylsulfatase [Holotrichia oblita]|uniref:Arylsulfatase n=1 Tax=Holotrichia oblita TaxID=644536 RepID=A0ACB9T6Q4_HOLOL|nr:arylsulfatase [Holotrichia oblita]